MPTAVARYGRVGERTVADIWIRVATVATVATLGVRWRSVECSLADDPLNHELWANSSALKRTRLRVDKLGVGGSSPAPSTSKTRAGADERGKQVAKRTAETRLDQVEGAKAETLPEQGKVSSGLGGSRRRGKLIIRWSLVRIQAGPLRKAPLKATTADCRRHSEVSRGPVAAGVENVAGTRTTRTSSLSLT
jgi:hypothetical protein